MNNANIPNGWELKTLGEVCKFEYGKPLKATERNETGEYPVFGSNGIVGYHDEYLVEAPFIIVGRKGSAGSVAYSKGNGFPIDTTFYIKCDRDVLDTKYLYEVLRNVKLEEISMQSGVPGLNRSVAYLEKIPLPPLPEQKAISNIFQTWDTAIGKTEALVTAKERRFAWFRQNVLTGLIRIKNYSSPWKYQLFQDVLTEHKLVSTGKEDVHSVSVHKGVINQIKHLGRSFSAKNTQKYNLVKPGDIIYTKSPTGDFPYGIIKQSKLQENAIVSPLYGVFSPRTYELGTILDAYFESSTYTSNYLRPVIQKGAKNTISCKNTSFLSRGLLLPTEVEEERSIAEHINTAKREIDTLKALADRYRTQKRGLMQKLLTGKWRVKVNHQYGGVQ